MGLVPASSQSGSSAGLATTYAALGQLTRTLVDDGSAHAAGGVAGTLPQIGPAWVTSGTSLPTWSGTGYASSAGTGYMAVPLPVCTSAIIHAGIVWGGTDNGTGPMALAFSSDATILVDNMVHLNFGPEGFNLTFRENGGSFDLTPCYGSWYEYAQVGSGILYHYALRVDAITSTVTVIGPSPLDVYTFQDPRVALLAGLGSGSLPFWEPNTNGTLVTELVHMEAQTLVDTGPLQPFATYGENEMAGALRDSYQRVVGNRGQFGEVAVGASASDGYPSVTFGPTVIYTQLLAAVVAGATSITTFGPMPTGTSIQIESGTNAETVTATGASSGSGNSWTTAVTALADNHAAGVAVIATPPVSAQGKMEWNSSSKYLVMPVAFALGSSGNFYTNDQTATLAENGSGAWKFGGTGTGKGAVRVGTTTTATRPATTIGAGNQLYDTTLGVPIWVNEAASAWINALGVPTGTVSAASNLVLGTAWQNPVAWDIQVTIYLNITVNTSGVYSLGTGPTNTPTQQTIITGSTSVGIVPITFPLPQGHYALLSAAGTQTSAIVGGYYGPL